MTNTAILFSKGRLILSFVYDITTIVDDTAKKIAERFKSLHQGYTRSIRL